MRTDPPPGSCLWAPDDDGSWWSACGNGFVFNDGTPTENAFAYCCYCGSPMAQGVLEDRVEAQPRAS